MLKWPPATVKDWLSEIIDKKSEVSPSTESHCADVQLRRNNILSHYAENTVRKKV